jgi:hypothetical protein
MMFSLALIVSLAVPIVLAQASVKQISIGFNANRFVSRIVTIKIQILFNMRMKRLLRIVDASARIKYEPIVTASEVTSTSGVPVTSTLIPATEETITVSQATLSDSTDIILTTNQIFEHTNDLIRNHSESSSIVTTTVEHHLTNQNYSSSTVEPTEIVGIQTTSNDSNEVMTSTENESVRTTSDDEHETMTTNKIHITSIDKDEATTSREIDSIRTTSNDKYEATTSTMSTLENLTAIDDDLQRTTNSTEEILSTDSTLTSPSRLFRLLSSFDHSVSNENSTTILLSSTITDMPLINEKIAQTTGKQEKIRLSSVQMNMILSHC